MPKPWERAFPNLGRWDETSPFTRTYNCFAWAAGETHRRWDPTSPRWYWPLGIPRALQAVAFVLAYETIGYRVCKNGCFENGFEKIAIYATPDGRGTHAARQLPDGRWTSKLGNAEDIIHVSAEALNSTGYGQPKYFMSRSKKN